MNQRKPFSAIDHIYSINTLVYTALYSDRRPPDPAVVNPTAPIRFAGQPKPVAKPESGPQKSLSSFVDGD